MIDDSEKRNRQVAFELQNSHVCEKRSKNVCPVASLVKFLILDASPVAFQATAFLSVMHVNWK